MIAMLMAAMIASQAAPTLDLPVLAGATPAPECGNVPVLTGAWCVSAPLTAMDALFDAYKTDLQTKGWLLADNTGGRAVLVRRREAGGCDGLQMLVARDTSAPIEADSVGILGVAAMRGDVCHAAPAAPQQ
jgi:hypothetical protein